MSSKYEYSKKKNGSTVCPICNKPRGAGKYEFAHGKCMEVRALTDGKKKAFPNATNGLEKITVEQKENWDRRRNQKDFLKSRLPSSWLDK
jgi:uncharacterized Zn finger protein (UPF0148 family)